MKLLHRENIPGWLLLGVLTVVAMKLSSLVSVAGKHPLEASALAIVLGMTARNAFRLPVKLDPGVKTSESFLVLGIVLMGASLNFSTIFQEGYRILFIIVITMIVGFAGTLLLARLRGLSSDLGLLLAAGTTICGGTAIAIIAPLIHAKEEDTSYAVTTITLWGMVAIFLYPAAAEFLQVPDSHFGLFAGTAIHSTPQVVGAGFLYSAAAGKVATAVKLIRNCFIAPLAFAIVFVRNRKAGSARLGKAELRRSFPWFLFAFFFMSWLNSSSLISQDALDVCVEAGRFLIIFGMAGVGVSTRLDSFRKAGFEPLAVGLAGAAVVAATSMFLITFTAPLAG